MPGAFWAVDITSDGRLVAAVDEDRAIRRHRIDSGRERVLSALERGKAAEAD